MSTIPEILPDCRLTSVATARGAREFRGLGWWEPIYCANCGADGGMVPEENMTFAFYLCNPCFEKHGAILGTYVEPDALFYQKVHDAQLEKYGRLLDPHELAHALSEPHHPLATLARESSLLTKR